MPVTKSLVMILHDDFDTDAINIGRLIYYQL